MKYLLNLIIMTLLVIFSITTYQTEAAVNAPSFNENKGGILYVKSGTNGNCTSWIEACELQDALSIAEIGNEIWVAAGTYKPTLDNDRSISFELISGVAVFGGFPLDGGDLGTRDWAINLTILSGDIGELGEFSDNSYHVIKADNVDSEAILDGFTITGGNANVFPLSIGGGIYNTNESNPSLSNLTISENFADYGGGMYNDHSDPKLQNITFQRNEALYGGGIANETSSPFLIDILFDENYAHQYGGGLFNQNYSSPTLSSVTFFNNTAESCGGGAYNAIFSDPSLTNVLFRSNWAIGFEVDGGAGFCNEIGSNPTLINVIFEENYTGGNGAGMYNSNLSNPLLLGVSFDGNWGFGGESKGGGLYNNVSSPILRNVTFFDNQASFGAGFYNLSSEITLSETTFFQNSAEYDGAGIYNGNLSKIFISNSTFSSNSADYYGGGIFNNNSELEVKNVTFYKNESSFDGEAIFNDSNGLVNVTNSILWGFSLSNNDPVFTINQSTTIIKYSDIMGGYSGDGNINSDPLLEEINDNGGSTLTHAPSIDSPVIDRGSLYDCISTDQRGFFRPIDGDHDGIPICDMGAYEFGSYFANFLFLPLIRR